MKSSYVKKEWGYSTRGKQEKGKSAESQQTYSQKQAADGFDLQGPRVPTPAPELRVHFTF